MILIVLEKIIPPKNYKGQQSSISLKESSGRASSEAPVQWDIYSSR